MIVQGICGKMEPDSSFQAEVSLLLSMMKKTRPTENRLAIGAIATTLFDHFPMDYFPKAAGAYCLLACSLVGVFGAEIPGSCRSFLSLLVEKLGDNPVHYMHYGFFVFAECYGQGVLNIETVQSFVTNAFVVIQQTKSDFDVCSSLRFLKVVLERESQYLTNERRGFLRELWYRWQATRQSVACQSALDYLSSLFLSIACHGSLFDDELVIAVLRRFPPVECCLTWEICEHMIRYFGNDVQTIASEIRMEGLKAIIRLLASGKSIRYYHKLSPEEVLSAIKLGVMLFDSVGSDWSILTEVLPDRPRKQVLVRQFFEGFSRA
jgi:hypothetical protein